MPDSVRSIAAAEHPASPDRRVYFGPDTGWLDAPVLPRSALATSRKGPCIIEEYDATCIIPPGATAALDDYGNILITLA